MLQSEIVADIESQLFNETDRHGKDSVVTIDEISRDNTVLQSSSKRIRAISSACNHAERTPERTHISKTGRNSSRAKEVCFESAFKTQRSGRRPVSSQLELGGMQRDHSNGMVKKSKSQRRLEKSDRQSPMNIDTNNDKSKKHSLPILNSAQAEFRLVKRKGSFK